MDVFYAQDLEAERLAIGAVLVVDAANAKRAFREIDGKMFTDEYHGWIWDRLSWACRRGGIDWENGEVARWLRKDGCQERARNYGGHLVYDLACMMNRSMGEWLHWYTARVKGAYKRRVALQDAVTVVRRMEQEAMAAKERWYQ